MFKKQISLFVATFLIIGFFFLALPQNGYSGVNPLSLGCCLDIEPDPAICIGCGGLDDCAIRKADCPETDVFINFTEKKVCFNNGNCLPPKIDDLGCCVLSQGNCNEGFEFVECDQFGVAWFFDTDCSEIPECPQFITNINTPIPTFNQWGLIAMAGLLGLFSLFIIIRRHRYNLS
jgi:hypothetical protein